MSLFFHSLDKKTRKCQMSKVKIAVSPVFILESGNFSRNFSRPLVKFSRREIFFSRRESGSFPPRLSIFWGIIALLSRKISTFAGKRLQKRLTICTNRYWKMRYL